MKQTIHILLLTLLCCTMHAANAVYTVESKASVSVSGAPVNATHTFEFTAAQKERLTAGTHATLTLNGYGKATIQAISLSMKSNKSSGSGWLKVTIDGKEVWSIANQSFSAHEWNKAYSTQYVEITKMLYLDGPMQGDEIVIHIESTENSLYINRYTIAYTDDQSEQPDLPNDSTPTNPPSQQDDTTFLVEFLTQIESQPGYYAYVTPDDDLEIPDFHYNDGYWSFCGWTQYLLDTITDRLVDIWYPGDIPIIEENTVFYAIYRHRRTVELTDNIQSNQYVLAYSGLTAKYLAYCHNDALQIEPFNLNDFYYADFLSTTITTTSDSTLYIQYGQKYLTPDNNDDYLVLRNSSYQWEYEKKGDNQFLIYTTILGEKYYIILFNNRFRLLTTYPTNFAFEFYYVPPYINTYLYYSYPQGKPSAVESPIADLPLHITGNQVLNPEKMTLRVVALNGQTIQVSDQEIIDLSSLPKGIYVIIANNRYTLKMLKQ